MRGATLCTARAQKGRAQLDDKTEAARQRLVDGLPLTTGQVALLAGVDVKTVGNWVRGGKMTSVRTPGGHHLIAASEVRTKVFGAAA